MTTDRILQLDELQSRMEETRLTDSDQKKAFEEQIQSSLNTILASDDSRRSMFQLSVDEEQQIVTVSLLIISISSFMVMLSLIF